MSSSSNDELFKKFTIAELVRFINNRDLSPSDLFEEAIRNYYKSNNQFHSFTNLFQYHTALRLTDESFPTSFRPLSGIPFGVKDIFNTKYIPTEMGSTLWKGFFAGNNARCVDSLLRSGALPFGKTVTAEFAVHSLNETLNPYDILRTPGTSSSGSAVAVATGIVPFSLGTQTAASIIRPAAFCGVWGMKPSFGLIPRTGSLKTTDSLDTIGFFSFFGSDLRRILSSIRVKGLNYPYVYHNLDKNGPFPKDLGTNWTVGVFYSFAWDDADQHIKNAVNQFIRVISSDSKIDVSILPDFYNSSIHDYHQVIYDKSLAYYFEQEGLSDDQISPMMADAISSGKQISNIDYDSAISHQQASIGEATKRFAEFDVIISLSTSTLPPLRHVLEKPDPSLIWTYLGMPSINVPFCLSPDLLPIGLQLSSKKYDDYLLLQFLDYCFDQGFLQRSSLRLPDT